jgi:hypothetical protein
MTKSYNKGDTLLIEYKVDNKSVIECVGLVFKVSNLGITVAHNFSGNVPVDSTKILLKDIVKSEKILPKEINSIGDLNAILKK